MLKPDFPNKRMGKEKWKGRKGINGKKEKEKDENKEKNNKKEIKTRTQINEIKMERQINEIKIETQIQATNPISAKTKNATDLEGAS